MLKIILLLLLLTPITASACKGHLIGFMGVKDQFDHVAFFEYSDNVGLCGRFFRHNDVNSAMKFIASNKLPYELYGYSLGAVSVRKVLENKKLRRPDFVITIGAYRTTNVNFEEFGVPHINYFDDSGYGQQTRGIFVNATHDRIQSEVNKILFKKSQKY